MIARASSPSRHLATCALAAVLALGSPARAAEPAAAPAAAPAKAAPAAKSAAAADGWRAARWGMSVDEVVAAFPGEASKLEKPELLADGRVVAAGIETVTVEGEPLRVRFLFEANRLVLVSLRTSEKRYVEPEVYDRVVKAFTAAHGAPRESDEVKDFIDQRQARWRSGRTGVDVKYIPGVVAVVYYEVGT